MHTTKVLVLLGGAKLRVEIVLQETGVMLQIRRQIPFLGGGVIHDGFCKELYFGHAKKDRDGLELDRMI